MKFHSAAQLASDHTKKYAQTGTVDLQAGAEPDFGGDKLDNVQAAGVLSFNSGRTANVRAVEPFLVLGNTVNTGEIAEIPESDAKYLVNCGRGAYATDEEVAAAQKGTKK